VNIAVIIGSIIGALIGVYATHLLYLPILRRKRGPLVVGATYLMKGDPYKEMRIGARITALEDVKGSRGFLVKYLIIDANRGDSDDGTPSRIDEQTFYGVYPHRLSSPNQS